MVDYVLTLISIVNKPATLKELEVSLNMLMSEYTEEEKEAIGLLLYSIAQKKISGQSLKTAIVDLISNRSHKLRTVGDYNLEFSRLHEIASEAVVNNTQCKNYGGLRYLEVIIMTRALSLYFNNTNEHKVISMVDLVDSIVNNIGGSAKLYWHYVYKWGDLGLINWGTSIKYAWFELENFEKPGLERYLKILNTIKENHDKKVF